MDVKIPPHSEEAEEAVLGSILIDPDVLPDIMETLRSADFYSRRNQLIFSAVEKLFDSGDPVDIVSITEKLRSSMKLEDVGGEVELTRLADAVPTSANFGYYVKVVRERSILRQLITAGSQIVESSYRTDDTDGVLDNAERLIFQITESQATKTYRHLGGIMHDVFENIEKMKDVAGTISSGGFVTGIPTGLKDLDKLTTGFHPSDLVIVAARPSMGKTALALSMAKHMALEKDIPVGIFCLEMTKEQLAQRLLCATAKVDLHKIRTGYINANEWRLLTAAADRLCRANIVVDDEPSLDPRSLRAKARRIKKEFKTEIMFVDYLQLMHLKGRQDNRQQEISEISRSLKLLARELNVTVVALSQLSRAVEQRDNKRPRLSDLRESGAIEQDADLVMFLYREKYYEDKESKDEDTERDTGDKPHETEINIGKQRNGPVGTVKVMFDPLTTSFSEATKYEV